MDSSTPTSLAPSLSPGDEADRHAAQRREARAGVAYGLAAYLAWGVVPLYYKLIPDVPALEILAHRVIWAVVLLVVLIHLRGHWGRVAALLRDRRTLVTLLGTTALIAANWGTFIYSILSGQLLQASLGYFINPLVSVLLGFVFLRERLRRWQIVSVILAAIAVSYLTIERGQVPTLALVLAFSFGCYGLLRKVAPVDAVVGLTVETSLLAPVALAYLLVLVAQGQAAFASGPWQTDLVLMCAGIITVVPLVWFTQAAKRLRLATVGFLQYIAPTGQFLLAVVAFGESFTTTHLLSFGLIWTALAIYSLDAAVALRVPRAVRENLPQSADRGAEFR